MYPEAEEHLIRGFFDKFKKEADESLNDEEISCSTCRYEELDSESEECKWCTDTSSSGGWHTEKGNWKPKREAEES